MMIVRSADVFKTAMEYGVSATYLSKITGLKWSEIFSIARKGKKKDNLVYFILFMVKGYHQELKKAHLARSYINQGYNLADIKDFIIAAKGKKYYRLFADSYRKVKRRLEEKEYNEKLRYAVRRNIKRITDKKRKVYSLEDRITIIKNRKIYSRREKKKSILNLNSSCIIAALERAGITYKDAMELSLDEIKEKVMKHFIRVKFKVKEGNEYEFLKLLYQKRSFKILYDLKIIGKKNVHAIAYKSNVPLFIFEHIYNYDEFVKEFCNRVWDYYNFRKTGKWKDIYTQNKKKKRKKIKILAKTSEEYAILSVKIGYEKASMYTDKDNGTFYKWLKNRGYSISKFKEMIMTMKEDEIYEKLGIKHKKSVIQKIEKIIQEEQL